MFFFYYIPVTLELYEFDLLTSQLLNKMCIRMSPSMEDLFE